MEPKITTLQDNCYAFGLLLQPFGLKSYFWRRGPFLTYFPHPWSAPGRIWPKRLKHVRGHEFFILTKGEPIYCLTVYRGTKDSVWFMIPGSRLGNGMTTVRIRICLSEIFLLEFTLRPFLSDLFILASMVSKPFNLQAPPVKVFCAFLT